VQRFPADLGQHAAQGIQLGRLDQMAVEARLACPAAILFLAPARERDDPDTPPWGSLRNSRAAP